MSSAIRNFLIVFLIFILIFGLVAWKVVVPYIDDVLLSEVDKGEDDVSVDVSFNEESGEEDIDTGRNRKVSIAFVGMATPDHIANISFIRIDETKNTYLTTSVPFDTVVDNGGRTAPLYSYLYLKSVDEIMETVPYLVGYSIDYYAVFDFSGLYTLLDELGTVTVSFPTAVKVYNPDFMEEIQNYINEGEPVPEAYYETFGPGDANVSSAYLSALWNHVENGDETDYTLKNKIFESVFYAITKKASLGTDSELFLELMNSSLATTLGSEAYEEYSDIMFANGYLFKGNHSKRMLYNQSYSKMVVKIRQAMGDY